MNGLRGVGFVGAVVAAVVVLSGCGGGAGEGKAPASPSVTVSPDAGAVVEESVYPAGPEGDIDRLADEKGWAVDDLYESASEFVADICDSLPDSGAGGVSRPQWLAESGTFDGDGEDILKVGVPKLCPEWSKALGEAVSGGYERWFGNGTYLVSSKLPPADDEEVQTISPGTYRASGAMEDCYWERTSKSGEIIDNSFATSVQVVTVTIASSDGQFTSRGCAVWKPVE